MAGTNPDPAESFDLIEFLRSGLAPAVAEGVKNAVREITPPRSANEFQTHNFALNPGAPVVLLGYDRARTRALVRATKADVYIGTLQQLSGGLGYLVPTAAGDEIKTIEEVYALYSPSGSVDTDVRITVWLERSI